MTVLTATLDCPQPACGVAFEGHWNDPSMDIEQMDAAPVADQTCPNGHVFEAEYPGWSFMGEAG